MKDGESPGSVAEFNKRNLVLLGRMPDRIRALTIDVEGTFCSLHEPMMRVKKANQDAWLCARLGVSQNELQKMVLDTGGKLAKKCGRRVSFSRIVYELDPTITCDEWNRAMAEAIPKGSFQCVIKRNEPLEEVITDLTADKDRGVRIIFQTNAAVEVADAVLKMIFGSRILNHGMFATIGHGKKISKPDPAFFAELVRPVLGSKGVTFADTISIGDRPDDDGHAAIEAGIACAIIVNGPDELLRVLKNIRSIKMKESK